jgi:hypothetical protein
MAERERFVLYLNPDKKEDRKLIEEMRERADNMGGFLRKAVEYYIMKLKEIETIEKQYELMKQGAKIHVETPAETEKTENAKPQIKLKKRGASRKMPD